MKKLAILFIIIMLSFSGIAQESENTKIDWGAFRLKVRKASKEAVRETNEKLAKADKEFHLQFHHCPCFLVSQKPNKYSEAAKKAQVATDQQYIFYYKQKNQD